MQGQINTDLNQTGKDQAAKAGKRLKNETFDKVRGQHQVQCPLGLATLGLATRNSGFIDK